MGDVVDHQTEIVETLRRSSSSGQIVEPSDPSQVLGTLHCTIRYSFDKSNASNEMCLKLLELFILFCFFPLGMYIFDLSTEYEVNKGVSDTECLSWVLLIANCEGETQDEKQNC